MLSNTQETAEYGGNIAHSIIILREKLEALKGNASAGMVADLLANVETAHTYQDNPNQTELMEMMHTELELLEGTLVNGSGTTGIVDALSSHNDALDNLIKQIP